MVLLAWAIDVTSLLVKVVTRNGLILKKFKIFIYINNIKHLVYDLITMILEVK